MYPTLFVIQVIIARTSLLTIPHILYMCTYPHIQPHTYTHTHTHILVNVTITSIADIRHLSTQETTATYILSYISKHAQFLHTQDLLLLYSAVVFESIRSGSQMKLFGTKANIVLVVYTNTTM